MGRRKITLGIVVIYLLMIFCKPVVLYGIILYQRYISPYKRWCCAYAVLHGGPSCSNYARTAIEEYGVVEGGILVLRRLWECQEAAAVLQRSVHQVARPSPKMHHGDGSEECGEMCGLTCAACCAAGCLAFLNEAIKLPTKPPPNFLEKVPPQEDDISSVEKQEELKKLLRDLNPTGASVATAKQEKLDISGVAASERIAQKDCGKVMRYKDRFEEAGRKYGVPPAVLAAIASRETHVGSVGLNREGWSQERSYGMMQIYWTNKPNTADGPFGQAHIDQAAEILKAHWEKMKKKYPDLSESQTFQLAVAAYNCGPNRNFDLSDPDRYTTGKDYSNDVLARAKYFEKHWNECDLW